MDGSRFQHPPRNPDGDELVEFVPFKVRFSFRSASGDTDYTKDSTLYIASGDGLVGVDILWDSAADSVPLRRATIRTEREGFPEGTPQGDVRRGPPKRG